MINSYKQLTGKYLKANKKRTILTIIGIILSVALISSIGLFLKGVQAAEIEGFKDSYGSYHLMFLEADEHLISKVVNNPKVSRSGLFNVGKSIKIGEKLTVKELFATDKALELLPYKIKQGRLPNNENEVAIEKWVLRKIDKNAIIGDKIKISDKTYTLVGILEDNTQSQIDNEGVLLLKNNNIGKENTMLLVEISSKANLSKTLKELRQLGQEDKIRENKYLLIIQGAYNDESGIKNSLGGLFLVVSVIIGIVVISTIAVIYNSFHISVVERIKQFGLLRAVGMTPNQIRKIVLREATFLMIIGVPIGLLCGIIAINGINIAFNLIGGDSVKILKVSISPMVMGISALIGIVSIYISALLPAFFAGKISPLVAISSRTFLAKEKIKRRKNLIIGKIFGFEGAMAAKNVKRNKKRYRITIFSIVISVVLFITFKSFMDMSLNISEDITESKNVHFSVIRDEQATKDNETIQNKIIEDIKSLESVDKTYKVYNPYFFQATVDKRSEIEEVKDMGKIYSSTNLNGKNMILMPGFIAVYDTEALKVSKKYVKSGNIDIERLNKENGVILIEKNTIYNDKTKKTYYGSAANVKVGDEIYLQYNDASKDVTEFGKGKVNKVKVIAILICEPFNFRGLEDGLKMITTEDMAKKLTGNTSINPINLNIVINDIKKEEKAKTEIEDILAANPSLQLINNIDNNRNEKSIILMVQILLYGFVIVVSLIASVNIVNTLTTNIILRRREFGALKSIGLTQKGLKKMIILEGFIYGIRGTIYGSIIACGLSYIMFSGLFQLIEFRWMIPWDAILIAGVCAIIIGCISVLPPLSRIKKDNLIETVREEF